MNRVAYFSVSAKDGIEEFAGGIAELGYDLRSHGGTYERLRDAGLEVEYPDDIIGTDARDPLLREKVMLDLAFCARASDEQIKHIKGRRIDLVCVDLTPINPKIRTPDDKLKSDFGGPTLMHAAAIGGKIVVPGPNYREDVLKAMRLDDPLPDDLIISLGREALSITSSYQNLAAKNLG